MGATSEDLILHQPSGQRRVSSVSLANHQSHFSSFPSFPSVYPQEMRAAATERVSRIRASIAALRPEDTEEMSVLLVALDKAQRQAAVPPLDHQIKATEDFIGRAKKRLLQHVVINEAQEAFSELVPEVPQVPRSVQELEQLVEQLQSERDGLAKQLKNQSFTRLVDGPPHAEFRGSRATRVGTIHQTVSSWRRHSDKPAASRMMDGLEAIGVARCSRDGRDWHHQGVVPVDLQWCAPDGGWRGVPWACPNTKCPQIGRTVAGHST